MKSKTLSISINRDPRKVNEFVSNPENLPKWAKAFCRSIKKSNGEWVVETLEGPVKIRYGILILTQKMSSTPKGMLSERYLQEEMKKDGE